ncbi:MAG TPA: thrombospondin type 3 repeat-containing protein [Pseudomonadota bacterium]|nr:thrombospondin type 3 repeat-containing protein [Pseudomonadota bacterium]
MALKTDPLNPDSDHDGASDGWEAAHGTNPINPADSRRLVYLPLGVVKMLWVRPK